MKKTGLLIAVISILLGSTVFASGEKTIVKKETENFRTITVVSQDKIRVTGYTVVHGNNIIVDFIKDVEGSKSDSIKVDIRTVLRPYKVILRNGDKPFEELFKDIKNNQMGDYIRHLYSTGYINGYEEDKTFRPDNNITRAELITIITRMLNLGHVKVNTLNFVDLEKTHWAYDDVLKAIENGIVEGYDENDQKILKLDQNVTFAEASKMIDEAFKIKNKSNANYDVRFVKHWSKENIQSLLNENIISSTDDFYKKGELNRLAKRGEIAMLLSRALGR